jgi:hypothetical protein
MIDDQVHAGISQNVGCVTRAWQHQSRIRGFDAARYDRRRNRYWDRWWNLGCDTRAWQHQSRIRGFDAAH